MITNSFNIEFSYELISVLPWAYKLHKEKRLDGTISGRDTACLYWFSPNHTEVDKNRSWDNMNEAWKEKIPNIYIHSHELDWSKFSPPPLKNKYKNNIFVYDKPIVCICNRINIEWKSGIINYFDIDCLDKLFKILTPKYQVIYFNIDGATELYEDGIEASNINDYDFIRDKWSEVKIIHDIHKEHQDITFNTLQLMIMANAENFITMCGGYGVLASYMGGTNIIYSKKSREIEPHVNSFYRWYEKFGGSRIKHVDNYESLYDHVEQIMVSELPIINILIRTSNRPNYFNKCVKSIYDQDYVNWNIIAGTDNSNDIMYLKTEKIKYIQYNKIRDKYPVIKNDPEYGIYFPFNIYMNYLQAHVKDGYIMYVDDDDGLNEIDSLTKLATIIKETKSDVVFFKSQFPDRIIPKNYDNFPVPGDVSTLCYAHNLSVIKYAFWTPYKRADYRVAKSLISNCKNVIYTDDIITKINRKTEDGFGIKDDLGDNKLGIVYNVYDDVELLKIALENSREVADYICVTYQNVSYTGLKSKNNIYDQLKDLKNSGLIDYIIPFIPNTKISPKLNEIKKRNIGINYCDKNNCTHYLSLDTDEFFITKELMEAKKKAYEEDFDFSVCKMLTYYHDASTILFPPEEYYIPFIIKMDERRFVYKYQNGYNLDPGRSMPFSKCYEFTREEVQMHHFSFVMKDIEQKLLTQPTPIKESTRNKILERFNEFKPGMKALTNNGYFMTKQVENEFIKENI